MSPNSILEEVLKLKPVDKAKMVHDILNSLDVPDAELDSLWEEEALKRYESYKKGSENYIVWKP